ncbi:pyridoxal phosphate-dependent decarboxylase family protein [Parvularcula dongshanensis]|uniref:Glutamate/tyrosine decarboxylase-like PLP-dependent enzyme n=1 Tax=Parvularcula dongshanensis TaxID=1173995 RepID=A0A840I447_9PROT|nr:pyridoxal-dependent decarboxylase [Parvularcula dongshanensis]MBB4659105.1 glutamate/tyrosine decarboxylase-like PLP-dependent enzyme [Parvularcula dongshanensis]
MEAERALWADADERAAAYIASVGRRPAFPPREAVAALDALGGPLPDGPADPAATLDLLDDIGSRATVTSNGPNYFGFVVGALLPIAGAAERLALAWNQCASSAVNSPVMDAVERTAAGWLLEVLDLPREAGVGFGTSATACGLACLAAAQTCLLEKAGWDLQRKGLRAAPQVRIVVPDTVHVTVKKAIRLLGFGTDDIVVVPTDAYGRLDPALLPALDEMTILCLQAGEVNTGEFDRFAEIVPRAKAAGAWVHVDGAFGLWVRASRDLAQLAQGVELADSWTTDGHKTLNTPYDGAVAICRRADVLARTMNAEAVYAPSEPDAQKNLTLEFSRRARGLGFWAVLRTLGRSGVADLVDGYHRRAVAISDGCRPLGVEVLNRVVFNQVLCRLESPAATRALTEAVQSDGEVWFGQTVWRGEPAFRLSVSSWRTDDASVARVLAAIGRARSA